MIHMGMMILLKNVLKTYYPNLEDNEAALEIAYSNVMLGFPETFSKKLKEDKEL